MQIEESDVIESADLKRFIGTAKRETSRYKTTGIIVIVVGTIVAILLAAIRDGEFEANLTFVIAEDGNVELAGIGSVLGQFGLGGGGLGQNINLYKVVELARSEVILSRVLDGRSSKNTNQSIEKLLIDSLDLREDINEVLERIAEKTQLDSVMNVEVVRRELVMRLRGKKVGEGLIEVVFDDESGIVEISVTSENEEVSMEVLQALYHELDLYYVNQSVAQELKTLKVLNGKLDSIRTVISRTDNRIASIKDREQAVLLNVRSTELTVLNREQSINTLIYGELLKNKSAAEFLLASKTPSFELVGQDNYPIEAESKGLVKIGFVTAVVMSFLFGLFVMVRAAFV